MLNDLASPANPDPALDIPDDLDHVQIELRRERPVAAEFLLAIVFPETSGAEIHKAEEDRFLDFVGVISREEDPGDVRLDQANGSTGVRVSLGT
jgi:hypothetical protein